MDYEIITVGFNPLQLPPENGCGCTINWECNISNNNCPCFGRDSEEE